MKTFDELQDDYGYNELTTGRNGYPSNITRAISCDKFETFNELQEFANENNLEVIQIHKKDGWSLWENIGNIYKPFEVVDTDFGDDYMLFEKMTEEEFISENVKPLLEEFDSFDEMAKLLKQKKEVWEQIDMMEESEVVITHCGDFYEKFSKHPMIFSEDTHTYSYALIEKI